MSSSTSTSSSSLHKKAKNMLYVKEMNNLIDKIIKTQKRSYQLSKTQFSHSKPNPHLNNCYDSSITKETEIKNVKLSSTRVKKQNSTNKSANSSTNESASISLIQNATSKLTVFTNQLIEIAKAIRTSNSEKRIQTIKYSSVISELLSYLKQEPNLTKVINENDYFISSFFDLFALVNFSGIKYTKKYKVTDINNNSISDNNLSKSFIEEFAINCSNGEETNSSTLIRIKNELWKEMLDLYDILITLLNNIPTINAFISKIPLAFMTGLIFSLNTLDNEERILIKIIIYKIYISSLTYRKYIIKNISNMVIDITLDNKNHLYCFNELLDLLKCILLGTKRPVSDYYVNIVIKIICPLLKCKSLCKQQNLKETIIKLMKHDTKLLNRILLYLLQTWPIRFPERIIIYMDLIENIFLGEINIADVDNNILDKVVNKIKCSFSDLSFLIADRSLIYFKNESFILVLYKLSLEKKFIKEIIGNIEKHWSQEIKIISKIVVTKLIKRDEKIKECLTNKEKRILDEFKIDLAETEDIWDIHFNLKGD